MLSAIGYQARSQTLEELEAELALLEAELDSVSLLGFIDSLISLSEPHSSLSLGLGYSNQVFTNGQDLGIEQFGINNHISYYHKSGMYGSYTGFINSETEPNYYLNILGVGYLGTFRSGISYNASYERSFFGENTGNALNNALNSSISYIKKSVLVNLSYSFLFRNESAHQFIPSITLQKSVKTHGFIKRIDFSPTFILFFANPNIITSNFSEDLLKEIWLINQFPPERISTLQNTVRPNGNTLYEGVLNVLQVETNKTFTLLNKSISLPVSIQFNDRLSLSVSFSYLFSEKLSLGTIVRDEERFNLLQRFFPRLENTLSELDRNITFENLENSTYLNLSLA
ncbi:MAG: hypothetical protein WBA74_15660, partial [Cyclobacteriaceae bacterium]